MKDIIAGLFVISGQQKAALLQQRSLTKRMSPADSLKGQAIVWN